MIQIFIIYIFAQKFGFEKFRSIYKILKFKIKNFQNLNLKSKIKQQFFKYETMILIVV
jgi:hypothetical protein